MATPSELSLHHDAKSALAAVTNLYNQQVALLRKSLARFIAGENTGIVKAFYPLVRIEPHNTVASALASHNTRMAYGFVAGPGCYEATLTRPDLFKRYYLEQFNLLIQHHGVPIQVGLSKEPISVHFATGDYSLADANLDVTRKQLLSVFFDAPNLLHIDDSIANGTHNRSENSPLPLSLFSAPRVDLSLHRLRHYSGTHAEHFQSYVLFTNYQFYVEEFTRFGLAEMQNPNSPYIAFIAPGNHAVWRTGYTPPAQLIALTDNSQVNARAPQMPAFHLVKESGHGISLINIGVGPSNAKTITDHIAVLRPHVWIMVGHCAGLQNSQKLGDYVLAHGYIRDDHVLDSDLPLWVPIPALAEVQLALQHAVASVAEIDGAAVKSIMRTGSVASTDNRNWELLEQKSVMQRFLQGRAVALDMESATIAANGYRFRVPYGTLLCVSDKPLHGELKLPGMANHFYRERVEQHLQIGIKAIEQLQEQEASRLHSRKLRSHADVAFR